MECESMDFKLQLTERNELKIQFNNLLEYLINMQLLKFKFLWKRLPKYIKLDDKVRIIYTLAKELWRQDYNAFFYLINSSEVVNTINKNDRDNIINSIRKHNIDNILLSYDNIHISKFANYIGLSEKEALAWLENENWKIDGFGYLNPKLIYIGNSNDYVHDKESITKLCQFMAHMENN